MKYPNTQKKNYTSIFMFRENTLSKTLSSADELASANILQSRTFRAYLKQNYLHEHENNI